MVAVGSSNKYNLAQPMGPNDCPLGMLGGFLDDFVATSADSGWLMFLDVLALGML